MLFEAFGQGARNLRRRKIASLLTMLGILVGICSVTVIDHVGRLGVTQVDAELNDMGVIGVTVKRDERSGYDPLGEKELQVLKQMDGVNRAIPVVALFADCAAAGKTAQCVTWGTDDSELQVFRQTLLHGRLVRKSDLTGKARVCVADENFARQFFGRENVVGKVVSVTLNGNRQDFIIVGVVQSGGAITQSIIGNFVPFFLYLPYPTLMEQSGTSGFTQISVDMADGGTAASVRKLTKELEAETEEANGFFIDNVGEKADSIDRVLSVIQQTLTVIAGISLLVSGLTIMLVMSSSVRERTKEIGLKKALGARNMDVALEFLSEALLLSVIGGAGGCLLGALILKTGSALLHFPIPLQWGNLLGYLLFSLLLGCLFGALPACRAARLQPADALRRET